MNLHALVIGKKKSEYDEQIAEYQKRIVAPFSMSLEILEPLGVDNPEQCKIKESEKLMSKLKPTDYIVALDEHGKDFDTIAFAKLLETNKNESVKRMVFIIGGAYGIDEKLLSKAQKVMRLSSMTLPHELARLILSEQCYRSTNWLSGGKYHHK